MKSSRKDLSVVHFDDQDKKKNPDHKGIKKSEVQCRVPVGKGKKCGIQIQVCA